MTDLLVMPSAKLVAPELRTEFGDIPPALIPLDGRQVSPVRTEDPPVLYATADCVLAPATLEGERIGVDAMASGDLAECTRRGGAARSRVVQECSRRP